MGITAPEALKSALPSVPRGNGSLSYCWILVDSYQEYVSKWFPTDPFRYAPNLQLRVKSTCRTLRSWPPAEQSSFTFDTVLAVALMIGVSRYIPAWKSRSSRSTISTMLSTNSSWNRNLAWKVVRKASHRSKDSSSTSEFQGKALKLVSSLKFHD